MRTSSAEPDQPWGLCHAARRVAAGRLSRQQPVLVDLDFDAVRRAGRAENDVSRTAPKR